MQFHQSTKGPINPRIDGWSQCPSALVNEEYGNGAHFREGVLTSGKGSASSSHASAPSPLMQQKLHRPIIKTSSFVDCSEASSPRGLRDYASAPEMLDQVLVLGKFSKEALESILLNLWWNTSQSTITIPLVPESAKLGFEKSSHKISRAPHTSDGAYLDDTVLSRGKVSGNNDTRVKELSGESKKVIWRIR